MNILKFLPLEKIFANDTMRSQISAYIETMVKDKMKDANLIKIVFGEEVQILATDGQKFWKIDKEKFFDFGIKIDLQKIMSSMGGNMESFEGVEMFIARDSNALNINIIQGGEVRACGDFKTLISDFMRNNIAGISDASKMIPAETLPDDNI